MFMKSVSLDCRGLRLGFHLWIAAIKLTLSIPRFKNKWIVLVRDGAGVGGNKMVYID